MGFLGHLKIRTKLLGGFGITTLLLIFGTLLGYVASRAIEDNLTSFYTTQIKAAAQADSLLAAAGRIQNNTLAISLSKNSASAPLSAITQDSAQMDGIVNALKIGGKSAGITKVLDTWQAYQTEIKALTAIPLSKDSAQTIQVGDAMVQAGAKFSQAVSAWHDEISANAALKAGSNDPLFSLLGSIMLGGGALGILIALVLGLVISANINLPLQAVTANMQQISLGKLRTPESQVVLKQVAPRGDELGILGKAFMEIEGYLENATDAAREIASGNLTVAIQPRSSQDQLGNAMKSMVDQLNFLVGEVSSSSYLVSQASQTLSEAARQTNQESGQISKTIQQVVQGINQQSVDLHQARTVFEKATQTIGRVSSGVGEQTQAITQIDQIASNMNLAIAEVNQNIQTVVNAADHSTRNVAEGSSIVRSTVTSMDNIQTQVEKLDEKVTAMGTRSGEISGILGTIEDIAIKTNILAINATIEAAHAKSQVKTLTENVLNQMMVSQCEMVGRLLTSNFEQLSQAFWEQLGKDTALDTILFTDDDGVVEICNDAGLVGWRFSDDPKAQTYPFRQLIHKTNGVYCQESQPRTIDNAIYKYVGITRMDRPGIIQVGFNMDSLLKFDVRIEGFAVVAQEVYKLAEQSHSATREIRHLISGIQTAIQEATHAMDSSRQGVETSRKQADQAGQALENILASVKDVYGQAQSAFVSTHRMQEMATTLNSTISTVSRVVNQNSAAASEMQASYSHVASAMQGIDNLSQQNSVSVKDASDSTSELRGQTGQVMAAAESLASLAGSLQQAIQQFNLN